jgi:hypothetical protein
MRSTAFDSVPFTVSAPRQTTVYYLVWRTRPSHPWHSEEFLSRIDAHKRYLTLIERGTEAYLQRRTPAELPA